MALGACVAFSASAGVAINRAALRPSSSNEAGREAGFLLVINRAGRKWNAVHGDNGVRICRLDFINNLKTFC